MNYKDGFHVEKNEDSSIYLEFLPRKVSEIEINIEDVRASDGIIVKYDRDRGGWVILQPKYEITNKGEFDEGTTEEWLEVGFFPSWNLEEKTFEQIRDGWDSVSL